MRKVLLGLCSLCPVWTVRVLSYCSGHPQMLPCFSHHYLIGQIPVKALTQWCLSPQQSGDTISTLSVFMTVKWRQAYLLLRETPIIKMIFWGVRDLCSIFCTCHLFQECFLKLNSFIYSSGGNYTHRANWSSGCSG